MQELKLLVPTYYRDTDGKPAFAFKNEYDEPNVRVLICEAEGVRVVLGSHDVMEQSKPEIQIERRPSGWVIFLHPEPEGDASGKGDASGIVYFLDDSRSFLVPVCGSQQIEVLHGVEQVPMIDDPPLAQAAEHRFPGCPKLAAAWVQAQMALRGDSNDDEHDALLALIEAVENVETRLLDSDPNADPTPHIVVPQTENAE